MHSITRLASLLLAAYVSPALTDACAQTSQRASREASNPACTLLTLDEIRSASGQAYHDASAGDDLGEGLGAGASCQWGGASFLPGQDSPLLSLVVTPNKKQSWTEVASKSPPRRGCTREKLSSVGEVAFIETCEGARGPVAYAKAGTWDLVVQMDARPPVTAASIKPRIAAVAKAAAAKLRTKT